MCAKKSDPIYRVRFNQNDEIYELYSRYLMEDSLMGFIEIEELLFDTKSDVVIDPKEERLRSEFKGVERCYLPLHTILRIDEVQQVGSATIKDDQSKVTQLPRKFKSKNSDESSGELE